MRIFLLWLAHAITATIVPVDALFVKPPSKLEPYPQLRLATADRLGIKYRGVSENAGKEASLPGFSLTLNAEFEKLNEAQFRALQRAYGGWSETKSRVDWDETMAESYNLLDFLPPILQAVSGLHFRSSRSKQSGLPSFVGGPNEMVKRFAEQEVLLTSNCWGFAWEVLYQADNSDTSAMTVSTGDPASAWRALTGQGFDLIQSSLSQPKVLTDAKIRNKKLQAGDVLLLWHTIASSNRPNKVYLDHVVTWIDDDVVYEKSGSGDRVPFRLSTWNMLTANFPAIIFNWEWRRLVRNNRNSPSVWQPGLRLKPATDVFGVDSSRLLTTARENVRRRFALLGELRTSVARQLSLTVESADDGSVVEGQIYTGILVLEDLIFDETTGRASLPPSAFNPETVRVPKLPRNPYG